MKPKASGETDYFACTTQSWPINAEFPQKEVIEAAAEVIRQGGLVAIPTETVYGLAANALDTKAIQKIYAAKGRPSTNPLIVHIAHERMVKFVAHSWTISAKKLAEHFWPGPLTLVVAKSPQIPDSVCAGGPTVAVRWPSHRVAQELILAAGVPLAAPSANRSGQLSPTRAEHVWNALNGRIEVILDAGPTRDGIESTVVDVTQETCVLLRPGPISVADLERVLGPIRERDSTITETVLPSPGLLARHYAPLTPLELVDANRLAIRLTQLREKSFVALVLSEAASTGSNRIVMPRDSVNYAARLFDFLHQADQQKYELILIENPPSTAEWLAVHDRLNRAATPAI